MLRICGASLVLLSWIRLAAGESARLEILDSLRCGAVLRETLSGWGATGEVVPAPGGMNGGEAFRLPTREIGVWGTLRIAPGGREAVLFRTAPRQVERIELDAQCRPSRSVLPGGAGEGGYSDRDLASDLARSDRLVVFLWSPHMPLSVDALPEISAAVQELGATLVALTDSSSERDYVEEVAQERGIPPDATRSLASVELLFRDLPVHAPSLIAFHRGRASAPVPGYRNRKAYARLLRTFFDPAR